MKYEQIRKDMVQAMKDRDKERKEAISSLVEAIKKVAIDEGHRDDISDELVDKIVMKELKALKEMIDTCPKERVETLEAYKKREAVIQEYAPQLMSEEEIKTLMREKFLDIIESKNKGLIMKTIMPELKGKADGSVISKVVEEFCK